MRQNIIASHKKEMQILFYSLEDKASRLLSKLLYEYTLQKPLLLQKHKLAQAYIQKQPLPPIDVDLHHLYQILNSGVKGHPYNIYISDKNYSIRNATFAADKGFDLSFAKSSFDAHYKHHIIGICTPILEKSSKQFFSYTDSYLVDKHARKEGILQVSYTYKNVNPLLQKIRTFIERYPNIKTAKAFIIENTGFINDVPLKNFHAYKPSLKIILQKIREGKNVVDKLRKKDLMIHTFKKDGVPYRELYIATQSPILDNTNIIFYLLLDEKGFIKTLHYLYIGMGSVVFLGIIAILLLSKLKMKELRFKKQDQFVQSSMHEIKTPLSIITLNNELRQLEFGKDTYGEEIENAIKTLSHAYDDMNFSIAQDKRAYPIEQLSLQTIVAKRIEYFKSLAKVKDRDIVFEAQGECLVDISVIELERLVDNNISNAIKYSSKNSTITIKVVDSKLSFHTVGPIIKNTDRIFEQYFRENNVVGGHGLGLSIVAKIAKRYAIHIKLISNITDGTTFTYSFICKKEHV
jgi:signal transduction histidine kinase